MKIALITLLLTTAFLCGDVAIPKKAHCNTCFPQPCSHPSACGHGCICLKKGRNPRGECYV